jgi:hypothetical protein
VKLSYNCVKQILQGAGMVKKGRLRGRHRRRRERKACFGQMLHLDGSPHRWLELAAEDRQTLIQVIDDATNRLLYAQGNGPGRAERPAGRLWPVRHPPVPLYVVIVPDDDDVPRGIRRRAGRLWKLVAVDPELATKGRAVARIALPDDVRGDEPFLVAFRDGDEVAGGVRGYGRKPLVTRRVRGDLELRAEGFPCAAPTRGMSMSTTQGSQIARSG